MSRDPDPLTPEERAMADALARAAPRRGPSPQIDAAILASARAAVASSASATGRRPRRRWPAALGVAASLVFAVGIAWQLRPAPEQALPAVTEGPPPSAAADQPAAAVAPRDRRHAEAVPAPEAPPRSAPAQAPESAQAKPAPAPPQDPAPPLRELAPPPPATADDTAAPPPPPAPPAPPAPAPEARTTAAEATDAAGDTDATPSSEPAETAIGRSRVRQERTAGPAPARTLDKVTTVAAPTGASRAETADDGAGIVFDRQALHDGPPATVDSPGIHRAWLDRIRELRDSGELEAARESLREYRRRYPDQALPDDLDGLLDE